MSSELEVENEVTGFYEPAKGLAKSEELAILFSNLTERGQKRVKTPERIRRENVTEMILEPIKGFDSDTFTPATTIPDNSDNEALQEIAVEIEKRLHAFYSQVAIKIDFLTEVAYSFELLAEAKEEAFQRLTS